MEYQKLIKAVLILLSIVLTVVILYYAKAFLLPLTFAALLAMLILPVCRWLEKKGVNKALSTILGILVLVGFFAALIAFISWQASDIAQNASKIEQQFSEKYKQAQAYISNELGISEEKQKEMLKKQQSSAPGKLTGVVAGFLAGFGGFLTDLLLVTVYIFLFLYFRAHLKKFVIRIVRNEQKGNTREIIDQSQKVTQKYLTGLSFMIIGLWIMYGIGFSIAGVKNAIFFAILCGVLEIVPFVGNLLGNALTIIMALIQGGGTNMIIGILVTYAIVQFIQSYILEPLVVGSEVNINPLFTIVGLVAAESIWGIAGMVLAIPVMGVTKIICDHIEPLKPYGEFMGGEKKDDNKLKKKMKQLVHKLKTSFHF